MNNQESQIAIAEVRKDIQYLTEKIQEGFKGVHDRQDTTNGKVIKNSQSINNIQQKLQHIDETALTKNQYETDLKEQAKIKITQSRDWKLYIVKTLVGAGIAIALLWIGTLIA